MAIIMQVISLILLLGMAHCWTYPSSYDQNLPSNNFRGLINNNNNNSTFVSIFDEMNKMMQMMRQRLFSFPSFSTNHMDDWMEDRKKLDAVEPVCTTTTSDPSSIQNNRRKKFRATQTTTCIKELTIDGKKHLLKEMNITDDKGVLISQSKIYQTMSINTMNNTMPINTDGDKNVISY
ncbi:unnamed protein product [Rotaria sordida]|uniref:Uncharacterized protein n=2 Tax=Rotaria sordida TaxID=392033 RepID=A0A819E797_9BILA|nr:unnamed protein product [Rotaria sordida]CAF4206371.1 unnamed protein product [Rotaria sordida]